MRRPFDYKNAIKIAEAQGFRQLAQRIHSLDDQQPPLVNLEIQSFANYDSRNRIFSMWETMDNVGYSLSGAMPWISINLGQCCFSRDRNPSQLGRISTALCLEFLKDSSEFTRW